MKKTAKIIAILLILVMLSGIFAGCLSAWVIGALDDKVTPELITLLLLTVPIDVGFFFVSIPFFFYYLYEGRSVYDDSSSIYITNEEYNSLPEYALLKEKIFSLPINEFASLEKAVNSLSETEMIFVLDQLSSISEEQRVSLISAYNSLPESEIISSIRRINALTEIEQVSSTGDVFLFTEEDIDSLIKEINSLY